MKRDYFLQDINKKMDDLLRLLNLLSYCGNQMIMNILFEA